jgi:excisionase family DNA binding protein
MIATTSSNTTRETGSNQVNDCEAAMNKLTTGQAAERLQYSQKMVERLIKAGMLKAERPTPTGQYRILEKDLVEYAEVNGISLLPSAPEK